MWKFAYGVVVAFALFAVWMLFGNQQQRTMDGTFAVKTDREGNLLAVTTEMKDGQHGRVQVCPDGRDPVVTFIPQDLAAKPAIGTTFNCDPGRDLHHEYRFDPCKDGRMPQLTLLPDAAGRRTWNIDCSPERTPSLQPGEHEAAT